MIISDLNYLETVDVNLAGGWVDKKNILFLPWPFPDEFAPVGVRAQVDVNQSSVKVVRPVPYGEICVWKPVISIKVSCDP